MGGRVAQQIAMGSSQQYLETFLQFNVAYRAVTSMNCRRGALDRSTSLEAAMALECFQQHLFALEDLATWAAALSRWDADAELAPLMERANADWSVFERLSDATPEVLVQTFRLPKPDDPQAPARDLYGPALDNWCLAARDMGRFATRAAQNGGQLANRLQNKIKHGLHFVAGVDEIDGVPRIHFYPHDAHEGQLELPSVRATAAGAEFWFRRTYNLCRLLAAVLTTLYVWRFGRDPVRAWAPMAEPDDDLSLAEIEATLEELFLPNVRWVDEEANE